MCARYVVAWFLVYGWLAVSAWAQVLTVDVVPGFDGICPGNGCFPVTVHIQGQRAAAPPTACEVVVTASSYRTTDRARKLVTLPGGVVSQSVGFVLCLPDEPYELSARLILRGRVLASSKPVSVTWAHWYPLLVGLGSETTTLKNLPQKPVGVVSVSGLLRTTEGWRNGAPYLPPGIPPPSEHRQLFIGRVRNSLPPESAIAYRGVAAVSLDDRAWDTLTERQQRALIHYVTFGGLLVVSGLDINRLQTLMPSGLLPVEPTGIAQVPVSSLAGWAKVSSRERLVDIVRSRALGDAQVLLRYGDVPLIVALPKGMGQVVFLAFDPNHPLIASEETALTLWRRLLALHANRFAPPALFFPQTHSPLWGSPPIISDTIAYSNLLRAMVSDVTARPVPVGWLVTYLGAYILVLIPLNYLLLRKMDKLQWSWFTLPALAVLMSAAGYAMATQVQTGSHQLRWWTTLYARSGSPHAAMESDWVLYSAHSQRYRLKASVEGIIVENSPPDLQAQRAVETPQVEPSDLRDVPIPLWSARTFHLSGTTSLQGTVNVVATRDKNGLKVFVRNRTPYTLKNLYVTTAFGTVPFGEVCTPGTEATVTVRPRARLLRPPVVPYPMFGTLRAQPHDTPNDVVWHEEARNAWQEIVRVQLRNSIDQDMLSRLGLMTGASLRKTSRGVLTAQVENFPLPAHVTPLSRSSVEHVTTLAIPFEVQGGRR